MGDIVLGNSNCVKKMCVFDFKILKKNRLRRSTIGRVGRYDFIPVDTESEVRKVLF